MRRTAISACLLTAAAATAFVIPGSVAHGYVSTKIDYGFPHGAVDEVQGAGADLRYGSHWAVSGDISGVDDAILSNQGNGTTPVIHWYYWGATVDNYGSNGVPCVDNTTVVSGCDGKSRTLWNSKAQDLANLIESMQGANETVVTLELEFHQGPTASGTTAENMDGYLQNQAANIFGPKPGIKTVLGFGEWASSTTYTIYDRAQAASDYAGTQILFSCYRQLLATYLNGPGRARDNAGTLQTRFPTKPVFIYDFGLSSYSGSLSNDPSYSSQYACREAGNYETHQETAYRELVGATMRQAMKDRGVIGVVFREFYDEPNRPNWQSDYHTLAEKYWGIMDQRPTPDRPKASYDDVINGIIAENGGGGGTPTWSPTFTVGGGANSWWIEVYTSSDVVSLDVIGKNGQFFMSNLPKQSFGAFGQSPPEEMTAGSLIKLIGRKADGSSAGSITFGWLQDANPDTETGWNASFTIHQCNTKLEATVSSEAVTVKARVGTADWAFLTKNTTTGRWELASGVPIGTKYLIRAYLPPGTEAAPQSYDLIRTC